MYLKLSIRNARRSIVDYLLYIVTMVILLSIMEVSNSIAVIGKIQAGFQTVSLPVLITIILIILMEYIDTFILKQRAKEFATYLLLGIEKNKLSCMFLCEFFIIGIACFVIGAIIGLGIYTILCATVMKGNSINITLYGKSLLQTFFYFCFVEGLCGFRIKRDMDKLQIRELIYKKNYNQKIRNYKTYKKWGRIFMVTLICYIGFLCVIAFLPNTLCNFVIPVIAIPLLGSIYVFYKWLFGYLYAVRQQQSTFLYHKNRLYIIAQLTSSSKTNVILHSIFCVCLLFSTLGFFFGTIMFQSDIRLFDKDSQQWMGFLQISISIIFMVIYFSILSLQQILEIRQESKSMKILRYIGKNSKQMKKIIKTQIAIKLFMPMFMTFLILLFSIPLINFKLNILLPITIHNILLKSAVLFMLCFLLFYFFYFYVVYMISKQYDRSK